MRDPNRIEVFLEKLGEEWKKVPDWRFGQLLSNFLRWYNRDPFFPEDDTFIELLQQFMKEAVTG